MNGIFITGTDTHIGKTFVTVLLLRALAAAGGPGARVAGFKPFSTGSREDAELIIAASQPPPELELVSPCWFELPTAPLVSIRQKAEAFPLQMESVWTAWEKLSAEYDFLAVEGVGGWLAPLLPEMRVADFAKSLDLPVLVVAGNRLGALNHTLLTVERILADGLQCAGVLLNNVPSLNAEQEAPARETNAEMLRELLPADVRLIAELPAGAESLEQEALLVIRQAMEIHCK